MQFVVISFRRTALCAVLAFLCVVSVDAQATRRVANATQKSAIKVTQIDIDGLKALLVPKGKPVIINFWATWCDPCREEFPDLVKLDAKYKGKVDTITISLDDVEDIATAVPKFLTEVKAEMPAYLLKTADESAAISLVAKDWSGSLPMTIVLDSKGSIAYQKMGKFKTDVLTAEIEKVLAVTAAKAP